MFAYGIILCEIIARIQADPDILPRTEVPIQQFISGPGRFNPVILYSSSASCLNGVLKPEHKPSCFHNTDDAEMEQECYFGVIMICTITGAASKSDGLIFYTSFSLFVIKDKQEADFPMSRGNLNTDEGLELHSFK